MGFRALGAEDLLQLNVLRAYRVDGSAVGRRLNLDGRRRSRGERHLGRRREIQVFGQIELFLEAGILFGALRRVGRVVHAQSRGSRERAQVGRRLLQAIEQQPGAALLQQAGGQRVQHLHPGHLHRVHVLQQRQDEAMRLAPRPLARHAHAAAQRLQMEMTIIAPAQRGSLAEDAVNFYVMAVIDWHKTLSFVVGCSLFALRFSLFAFRQNRWYPDRGLQSPSRCHPDQGLQSPSCVIPTEDFSRLLVVIPTEDFSPLLVVIPTEDFSPLLVVIPTEDFSPLLVVIPTEDFSPLLLVIPTEDFSPLLVVIPTEDFSPLLVVIPTEDFSPLLVVIPTEDFSPLLVVIPTEDFSPLLVVIPTEDFSPLLV